MNNIFLLFIFFILVLFYSYIFIGSAQVFSCLTSNFLRKKAAIDLYILLQYSSFDSMFSPCNLLKHCLLIANGRLLVRKHI